MGPGVHDIHSPHVPGVEELTDLVAAAAAAVPGARLWVNPDCGVNTRTYAQIEPALARLVAAAQAARERILDSHR